VAEPVQDAAAAPGPASTDLLAALFAACDRFATKPALTTGRTTLTYRDLKTRVLRVASTLHTLGMVHGDRVLFSVRPGVDATCLALGIIAAGGTVVFADPGAGETMFRARAELAAARWVAAESLLYLASAGMFRRLARRRGIVLPRYRTVVPGARHIFSGPWMPGVPRGAVSASTLGVPGGLTPATAEADQQPDPTAEALIIFTSGTTDDPKAVVHSRESLGTGLADFARHTRIRPGDRVLTDQLMVGIPALIAGAHWTLPGVGVAPGARPNNYLDLLPEADVLFAVPAALDALLTLLETRPDRVPALTTLIIGGAPVLRPLLERARRQLPETRIRAIYGMTEILPVAVADGDEKLAFTGEGDYVGELVPSVTGRIVDGELVLTGPGIMLGYLGKPPLDEIHTGDLARMEGDRLILNGRSKDMFIRGTTNVYPGLYEPVIAGIPGVNDVAMVGVPDAVGNERIVLVVVPAEPPIKLTDEHPLIAGIRRGLPGLIDAAVLPDAILAAPALPRSGRAQKVDRARLATEAAAFLP
jgi:acyl-CoA synthetase (AMP-forming)/AMP-acid ligase II